MSPMFFPTLLRKTHKKAAIVGGGPTRSTAPFDDPSWDIWGFSSKDEELPRITRWFEIHHLQDLKEQLATAKDKRRTFEGYWRFMRELSAPVYMMETHPDIPNSVAFPLDDLLRRFGRRFTSTAAFLIALAIAENYREIGLWGVTVRGAKYAATRPAIAHFLGVARDRGIKLHLPADFDLDIPSEPNMPETDVLYAYDWQSADAWWRKRLGPRANRRRRWQWRRHRAGSRPNAPRGSFTPFGILNPSKKL